MKKQFCAIAILALLLTASSCSKLDVQESLPETVTVAEPDAEAPEWTSVSSWNLRAGSDIRLFETTLPLSVSAPTAESDLVLVYARQGSAINQLPFETEDGNGSVSWYYQVTGTNVRIFASPNSGSNSFTTDLQFSCIVIPAAKREELETAGYAHSYLMELSYKDAKALLQKEPAHQ